MATKFPLLRLPIILVHDIIKNMEIAETLHLSLCSKRAKNVVRSVIFQFGELIHLKFDREITFYIGPKNTYGIRFILDNPSMFLKSPVTVEGFRPRDRYPVNIKYATFLMTDWLEHIKTTFYYSTAELIFFNGAEVFKVKDICKLVKCMEISSLYIIDKSLMREFTVELLTTIQPTKNLHLNQNPFLNMNAYREILSKSYETLNLFLNVNVTVTDILITNSMHVTTWSPGMGVEDLNLILKAWKSGWSSKLKQLHIRSRKEHLARNYVDKMLEGIEHKVNREKMIYQNSTYEIFLVMHHGYNIVREDGSLATVYCSESGHVLDFFLIVWN